MTRVFAVADLTIGDFPGWWLDVRCRCRTVHQPLRMLSQAWPAETCLADYARRLRCRHCGIRPVHVALIDDPRLGAVGFPTSSPQRRLVITAGPI
ncbi:hypothetical protein [Falsiroseomonas sp.]|uniref:hypothetical protein n=1 Tax=Falsiroseomonas sp. TaxID=2870721 RepID=UPI0027172579|nr:hypothetical protein [Falsiroseomonas sp.]MDO9498998.1 hypothetical protein [Falsiroseomonas sp.]